MSLGARAWYAYHSLPRRIDGAPPPSTELEAEFELGRGVLGKIFSGKQHSLTPPVAERAAAALRVTTEFLSHGRGGWPTPTGPVPPRIVKYQGGVKLDPHRIEYVAPPTPGSAAPAPPPAEAPPDTLRMAREACESLARHLKIAPKDAWAEFFDLPPEMHKGVGWTSVRMLEWALGRRNELKHAAGMAELSARSGPVRLVSEPPSATQEAAALAARLSRGERKKGGQVQRAPRKLPRAKK